MLVRDSLTQMYLKCQKVDLYHQGKCDRSVIRPLYRCFYI